MATESVSKLPKGWLYNPSLHLFHKFFYCMACVRSHIYYTDSMNFCSLQAFVQSPYSKYTEVLKIHL